MARCPNAGHGLLVIEVSRSHTNNTQHSQQTSIYARGGIRTYNLRGRGAADLRVRPRGHWERQK